MEKCNHRNYFFCKKVICSSKTFNFAPKVYNMKKLLIGTLFLWVLMGCEKRPSLLEQRKAEIRRNDSLELVQAQTDLLKVDSVATFMAFEIEDLKKQFFFEKQEKFQTTGYWVLPAYKGSKERFTFFPEVEEGGKLLLVSIDRQRRYSFQEIHVDEDDYTVQLPSMLSETQRKDVAQCYALAKAMGDLSAAKAQQEKLQMKVRFYEEKLKHSSDK